MGLIREASLLKAWNFRKIFERGFIEKGEVFDRGDVLLKCRVLEEGFIGEEEF